MPTVSYNGLLLLLLFSLANCQAGSKGDKQVQVEESAFSLPAPDTLPYPVIKDFTELAPIFAQETDTTYVINFWATWCAPCVAELPYFEQLAQKYHNEPVRFVMVSLDFKREIDKKLLRFVRERPLELPVVALIDPATNVWIDKVDANWTGAIPITVIYKKGKRLFHDSSFSDYAELETAFLSIH